jgi:hypothetical protein
VGRRQLVAQQSTERSDTSDVIPPGRHDGERGGHHGIVDRLHCGHTRTTVLQSGTACVKQQRNREADHEAGGVRPVLGRHGQSQRGRGGAVFGEPPRCGQTQRR